MPTSTPTPSGSLDPELVGFIPGVGPAQDVVVQGGIAFVASEVFGLSVVDVSNPGAPVAIGGSDTPFFGEQVAVRGSLAVIGGQAEDGFAHLQVLDVSDVSRPVLVGEMSTNINAAAASTLGFQDIEFNAAGTIAVAAMGLNGVWMVDVTNPGAPSLAAVYDTNETSYGVEVSGGLAYVADGRGGLKILDVSNPAVPSLVGSLSLVGIIRDVAVNGVVAYLANQQGMMQVVLVNDPSSPREVSSVFPPGLPFYISVEGGWAALILVKPGDGVESLDMVDISSPLNPVLVGSTVVGPVGTALGVELVGGVVYAAANQEGLKIYNTGASFQGVADDDFEAGEVSVSSGVAAVVGKQRDTGNAHLKVIDVDVPAAPRLLGEMPTSVVAGLDTGFQDVELNGNSTLAVTAMGWDGIWTIDLGNPANPVQVGSYNTTGTVRGVDLDGALVYAADGPGGLKIIDVSNAGSPRLVGSVALSGLTRDVAVAAGKAYLANQLGMLDVVDLGAGSRVDFVTLSGAAFRVALEGTRAVVLTASTTTQSNHLDVVDLVPVPQLVGSVTLGPSGMAQGVDLAGGRAFVAASGEGLQIYDLSNPSNPQLLGSGFTTIPFRSALPGRVPAISPI
jgi:hypothetical protein